MQNIGDVILNITSGGVGATLLISYALPRDKGLGLEKRVYSPSHVKSGEKYGHGGLMSWHSTPGVQRPGGPCPAEKKSEIATRRLYDIAASVAELICRMQKIRTDNKKFGTVCKTYQQVRSAVPGRTLCAECRAHHPSVTRTHGKSLTPI